MEQEQAERRIPNSGHRRQRVTLGGISAPVAILVAFAVNKWLKNEDIDNDVVIAATSLVGSAITWMSICFYDMRGIALAMIYQRRETDPRWNRAKKNGR